MGDVVIRAENVSKRYRIGEIQPGTRTLRETLSGWVKLPWSRPQGTRRAVQRGGAIWALRGVTFDVTAGEVVGIVGRNGAGKSTLLKILARITEPTEGNAEITGRVGSLLEVGTGFHPELTGRENVFLNGAILGMRRVEINRQFDAIVEFSGVPEFIDTPVKFYSSGMRVRLAFAVAAHLDPEILFVDEVLAVGDTAFQEKCLNKMSEVASGGRTVMFVSHNLTAVSTLCPRSLYLESGQVVLDGETQTVIEEYLRSGRDQLELPLAERQDRQGTGRMRFTAAALVDTAGNPVTAVQSGQTVQFVLNYQVKPGECLDDEVVLRIRVEGAQREKLIYFSSRVAGATWSTLPSAGRLVCIVPELPLAPGRYVYHLFCTRGVERIDHVPYAGTFEVVWGDFFGTGRAAHGKWGQVLVRHSWHLEA